MKIRLDLDGGAAESFGLTVTSEHVEAVTAIVVQEVPGVVVHLGKVKARV